MTDIRMSADVRAVLGPDGVAQAGAVTLANAVCVGCETRIDPDEPANVVVRIGGRVAHVRYAHARCHASAVVRIPEARTPRTTAAPTAPDEGVPMLMTASSVEHGRAVLPTLFAEIGAPVFLRTGTGSELMDVLASRVLARGFSPVGRMRQAPPRADQWLAAYTTPGLNNVSELTVMEPDGTIFYTGPIHPPAQWIAGVEQYGWSVMYVGKAGIGDVPADDQRTKTRLMREAAAAGRFVGARIAVHHRG